ncbi:hypothetical protein B0T20DRAFT_425230 [Sordaria brevicollis]|uniref:Uncharacterized protein n=1 Tax=Sordaria brevicollis TaxID=83679 RepID=A0AAE0NWF7_SORBR|nr:hypothetical protein B0T20DRAFT_425230 [Sordaria brevicollis]
MPLMPAGSLVGIAIGVLVRAAASMVRAKGRVRIGNELYGFVNWVDFSICLCDDLFPKLVNLFGSKKDLVNRSSPVSGSFILDFLGTWVCIPDK